MTQPPHRRRKQKTDTSRPSRHRGQPNHHPIVQPPPPPPPPPAPVRFYDEHWHPTAVRTRLQSGQCFVGLLRINAKGNGGEGYVTIPGIDQDVMVRKTDLNRAFSGDTVAVRISQPRRWWTFNSVPIRDQPAEMPDGVQSDGEASSVRMCHLRQKIIESFKKRTGDGRELHLKVDWDQVACPEDTKSMVREIVRHFPERRPTGFVVSIVQPATKRSSLVGFIQRDAELGVFYFAPLDVALPRVFNVLVEAGNVDWRQLMAEAANGAPQRTMVKAEFAKWDVADMHPTALVQLPLSFSATSRGCAPGSWHRGQRRNGGFGDVGDHIQEWNQGLPVS